MVQGKNYDITIVCVQKHGIIMVQVKKNYDITIGDIQKTWYYHGRSKKNT